MEKQKEGQKARTRCLKSYNLRKGHIKVKNPQGQAGADKEAEHKVRLTWSLAEGRQGGFNTDNFLLSFTETG